MATEFKRATMGDVPTTALPNTSNANSDLYTVPANCDTVVIGLLLTNISAGAIIADVLIEGQSGQGDDVFLLKNADIPYGSALEVISGKVVLANTRYGKNLFCTVVRSRNIVGCQFHPERSGQVGLKILENFLQI